VTEIAGPGSVLASPVRVAAPAPSRPRLRALTILGALGLAAAAVGAAGTGFSYEPFRPAAAAGAAKRKADARAERALARLAPRGIYIVIDSGENKIYLRRGGEIVLKADCSTGSGLYLKLVDGGKSWTFDTPRGQFEVLYKTEYPMWKKPDWAFLEEGKPVPDKEEDRFEAGVLGEYGLYFGDGYLIHGTLYERLLGQSVTHGCVRVGRDPLREIWKKCPLGTPIFIY